MKGKVDCYKYVDIAEEWEVECVKTSSSGSVAQPEVLLTLTQKGTESNFTFCHLTSNSSLSTYINP